VFVVVVVVVVVVVGHNTVFLFRRVYVRIWSAA